MVACAGEGTLEIPGRAVAVGLEGGGLSAKLRGDELLYTASYLNLMDSRFDDESTLSVVDTTHDTVTATDVQSRCGYLLSSVEADTGDLYFGSNVYTSIVERVLGEDFGGPSCVRRGSLIPGADGTVYTRVLDESLLPSDTDFDDPQVLSVRPFYRWAERELEGDLVLNMLDGLDAGAAQSVEYQWINSSPRGMGGSAQTGSRVAHGTVEQPSAGVWRELSRPARAYTCAMTPRGHGGRVAAH